MKIMKRIRPSNLVLVAAAPFIIYLFYFSTKYQRSLFAILGIESGSGVLFTGCLLLVCVGILGCIPYYRSRQRGRTPLLELMVPVGIILQLGLLAYLLIQPASIAPFVYSVIANSVDPFTSDWIVPTVRPRQLTPEVAAVAMSWVRSGLVLYGVVFAGLMAAALYMAPRLADLARKAVASISLVLLVYLLFLAHWGFASGVAITLRAAVFAYLIAAILGLGWAGLQLLKRGRRTTLIYGTISAVLLLGAATYFAQPKEIYVLVGTTEARIAIIKGTPQYLADTIRFGEYPGADGKTTKIRSSPDVQTALELIHAAGSVSGAFLPQGAERGDLPVLWETSFLPPKSQVPGLVLAVVGFLLLVLTVGAHQHGRHPLSVGSEFFVDTIRGIPMLVIILYIGLPLSGAIKSASSGVIDLPNMMRGIVAISIGYSAYMAEIFRAGIESISRGQLEAAASLGLSRAKIARLIVLPQALRVVIPPLGNEMIAMIKDTSLLSILSVRDITQRMREFQASSFLPFAPFNTAAIVYVFITLAAASFLKWIERRYEKPGA
jgi:polar amino acid transport system permease protein